MFCVNCGSKLKEGVKFCQECGQKVGASSNSVDSDSMSNQGGPASHSDNNKQYILDSGSTNNQGGPARASEELTCTYCGNQLSAGATFCGKCWQKVGASGDRASGGETSEGRTSGGEICSNISGNIANGGFVAMQGDRLYFSDGNFITSMKSDGTDRQKLDVGAIGIVCNINVVGERIYFTEFKDYDIEFDDDDTELDRSCIIYAYFGDNEDYYSSIYSIKTDGTDKRKLNDDISYAINVVGDQIFYINTSDVSRLYSIKTDGTGRRQLNDEFVDCFCVVGEKIYYFGSKYDEESSIQSIYSINTDGTGRQKLDEVDSDLSVSKLVVLGDRIYCIGSFDGIYSIKTNGTDKRMLYEDDCSYETINVANDRVYYVNEDEEAIYSMNPDGTDKRRENVKDSQLDDGTFLLGDPGGTIKRYEENGYERDDFSHINIVGRKIYYLDEDFSIYSINLDGTDRQVIIKSEIL
jgi:DNA-directed RNA polymerase subunit M/transcription elongation factor TFIIS